jgi:hypothetical protein
MLAKNGVLRNFILPTAGSSEVAGKVTLRDVAARTLQ